MKHEKKGSNMFSQNPYLDLIVSGLVQNFIWTILAVLFAQYIQSRIEDWRYGKWRVIIMENGKELLNKAISTGKAKNVFSTPEDKLVYLKGLVSPFGKLVYDLIDQGTAIGLYQENKKERKIIIDLDKNKKPEISEQQNSETPIL